MDSLYDRYDQYVQDAIKRNNGDTGLHVAIENDDIECIKLAIEYYGANIDATNNYGNSCLELLTFMNIDVMDYFHVRGHDITKSKGFRLKLYMKNIKAFEYLFEHNLIIINDNTLISAIISKNLDIIKFINEKLHCIDFTKYVFMKYVVNINNLEILKYMVDAGGKIKLNTLVSACANGYDDIIRYLITEHKMLVDTDMISSINYHARKSKDKEILKLAYNNKDFDNDKCLLYVACHLGLYDIIELSVRGYQYDIDEPDNNTILPIKYALYSGNMECVDKMINVLKADTSKLTIQDYIRSNNIEIVKKYCDINDTKNISKHYVMETVIDTGNIDMLEYFMLNNYTLSYPLLEYMLYTKQSQMFIKLLLNNKTVKLNMVNIFHQGCHGNDVVLEYMLDNYKFKFDDYKVCAHAIIHKNNMINCLTKIYSLTGNELFETRDTLLSTLYSSAADYGLINTCEYIQNNRGY